jgi:K+-transporting ATPase ATPase A chain
MWFLPLSIIVFTIAIALPLSKYRTGIMEGKHHAPRILRWVEKQLDSGEQDWKQYSVALLVFNTALFIYGYLILSIQPWMPLNPQHKGLLSPTTIFNSAVSFMTNTNLQHYSGDQHLSNFSQIFFCIPNFFLSAAVGLCALTAIIRLFRGEKKIGNFFVDMWRVVIYIFLPVAFILALVFVQQGMPMTYRSSYQVSTLEPAAMGTTDSGQAKQQTIVVGPLAAFVPQKMLGTNGGGFYGMNSAHPMENPTEVTNFLTTFAMMIFPFCLVLMYGRMLGRFRHSLVIFSVMLVMFAGGIAWAIYYDTIKPNPGLIAHPMARSYEIPSATAPGWWYCHPL